MQRQLPEQLLAVSDVTQDECNKLMAMVKTYHERNQIPDSTRTMFNNLGTMEPTIRLTRNLKIILSILSTTPIQNVLWEGVLESERLALLDLEHVKAPVGLKATAQGLLNLNERMHLVESVKEVYRRARLRHWE